MPDIMSTNLLPLSGKRLILGSASPRRSELLRGLGFDFEVDTGNSFKEDFGSIENHRDIPALMSEGKSCGFHRDLEDDEILLTSDTVVLCGDVVMGKPSGYESAFNMLKTLSGRTHEVITAVTIRSSVKMVTFSDVAEVHFRVLEDDEIRHYLDVFRPFDKAGAYGIQEWIGYVGIDFIRGSFYTIMGLPVHRVYSELADFLK